MSAHRQTNRMRDNDQGRYLLVEETDSTIWNEGWVNVMFPEDLA